MSVFLSRLILVFLCFSGILLYGQESADDSLWIDSERIVGRKVVRMLQRDSLVSREDLHRLRAHCYQADDPGAYSQHLAQYVVAAPPGEVWQAYLSIPPHRAWQGKIGRFSFMYNRPTAVLHYHSDPYEGMAQGQLVFLELGLLGGLFNLAVGHEITLVDHEHHRLEFCYLEQAASEGSQAIWLEALPNGHTLVHHQTFYRSASPFRDKQLYPRLHQVIISEFHRGVARYLGVALEVVRKKDLTEVEEKAFAH